MNFFHKQSLNQEKLVQGQKPYDIDDRTKLHNIMQLYKKYETSRCFTIPKYKALNK